MRISGRRVDTEEVVTLTMADGRIASIDTGSEAADYGGPELWLAPGFFDTQMNGYAGHDFNSKVWGQQGAIEPALYELRRLLARAGTALYLPTITTNSSEAIHTSLASLARALDTDPAMERTIPGFHVEGPYIASEDGPRGAHPLEFVRDPDWEEFQRWQEAAGGRIRILTLAPERSGALAFIEKAVSSGVIIGIGHTGAEPETIQDAVHAGARLSVHLGNGSHGMLRRHPNYIWEQLADDRLYASLITDGHHLPPSVAKCMVRAKRPEHVVVVSDAVSLGGLPAGLYHNGRYEVLPTGKVTLAGTPYLAGAGHLLDTCVANVVRFTDLTLSQSVDCVTANPARLLGLEQKKGRLEAGFDADLTLFRMPDEGPLEVDQTFCGGELVNV